MKPAEIIYVGVKGSVVAFQKSDGAKLWETHLKSSSFVTLLVEGPHIFAHTYGELFCLDSLTGQQLWHDELEGLGFGLASLAVHGASSPASSSMQSVHQAQVAASTATAAAAVTAGAAATGS